MTYGVGAAWEVAKAGGAVKRTGEAVAGVAGAGLMTEGEDVLSAEAVVLARLVLEPPL